MREWQNDASRDLRRRDANIQKQGSLGTALIYSSFALAVVLGLFSAFVYRLSDMVIFGSSVMVMMIGVMLIVRKLGYNQGKAAGAAGLRP